MHKLSMRILHILHHGIYTALRWQINWVKALFPPAVNPLSQDRGCVWHRDREREGERERRRQRQNERVCVCVCVCMTEREIESECCFMSVCIISQSESLAGHVTGVSSNAAFGNKAAARPPFPGRTSPIPPPSVSIIFTCDVATSCAEGGCELQLEWNGSGVIYSLFLKNYLQLQSPGR